MDVSEARVDTSLGVAQRKLKYANNPDAAPSAARTLMFRPREYRHLSSVLNNGRLVSHLSRFLNIDTRYPACSRIHPCTHWPRYHGWIAPFTRFSDRPIKSTRSPSKQIYSGRAHVATVHWINFKGDARLINNGPSNGFSFGSSEYGKNEERMDETGQSPFPSPTNL